MTAEPLLRVDARPVASLVRRMHDVTGLLRQAGHAVRRLIPESWSGGGRAAADRAAVAVQQQLDELATATEAVGLSLSALLSVLQSVQAQLQVAHRVVVAADQTGVRSVVEQQLAGAVAGFEDADRRAAQLVYDALLGVPLARGRLLGPAHAAATPWVASPASQARDLSQAVMTPAPAPAQPAEVAVWWAGLPFASRAALMAAFPWLPGGLDGVPPPLRDKLNRQRLAFAIGEAQRDAARTRESGFVHDLTADVSWLLPWPLSASGHTVADQVPSAVSRLRALQALRDAIRGAGTELLVFDGTGDGRAVVATGDVEAGRSVAVIVPGLDTTLEDAPELLTKADQLAGRAGRGTVAIAWLGYDAPNVAQVVGDGKARSGAKELERFTAGVRATGLSRQHLTVIGHSYGTLVAGIAARDSPGVDDLVLLASPGVEVSHAAELRVPPGHVWAVRAATDPIQLVFWPARLGRLVGVPLPQVFGPDPAASEFGARDFAIGGAYGHSGYFTAGSQSLDNLARIVSGRPALP